MVIQIVWLPMVIQIVWLLMVFHIGWLFKVIQIVWLIMLFQIVYILLFNIYFNGIHFTIFATFFVSPAWLHNSLEMSRKPLEKTHWAIQNGKSRDQSNIGHKQQNKDQQNKHGTEY